MSYEYRMENQKTTEIQCTIEPYFYQNKSAQTADEKTLSLY